MICGLRNAAKMYVYDTKSIENHSTAKMSKTSFYLFTVNMTSYCLLLSILLFIDNNMSLRGKIYIPNVISILTMGMCIIGVFISH